MQYADINWRTLHHNALSQKKWKSKSASDWDKKASSFSSGVKLSKYSQLFLENISLQSTDSVLDIGAGTGALSLPIAPKVARVTALDYSQGMLAQLQQDADNSGVSNITPICAAWEDSWAEKNISAHDIVIASRSLGVEDLHAALVKLNRYARKKVYISDRIAPTPFDSHAFALLDRPFHSGPDYIYSINMLYSMGITPNLRVLEFDQLKRYPDFAAALEAYRWMFDSMTTKEEAIIAKYIKEQVVAEDVNGITVKAKEPYRWAMMWWTPPRD